MPNLSHELVSAAVFTIVGAGLGAVLMLAATAVLPRIIDRLTPSIDEEKEIVRGNRAVADYFGRVVGASILGMSIVIAAAIVAGIHG